MPATHLFADRRPEGLPRAKSIAALRKMAAACERCPLFRNAIQTVFGEGPDNAAIMMVGEQPGDQEDRQGHPFVGPAGKVLDRAMAEAGIDRAQVYLTNTVKHFKNEPRGKRRLHKRPNQYEISRCRWWLDGELALVKPRLIVALGGTAAAALAGRPVVISRARLEEATFAGIPGVVTNHPSAILRMRDEAERKEAFEGIVADLRKARKRAEVLLRAA
jgi:DNA polymerase